MITHSAFCNKKKNIKEKQKGRDKLGTRELVKQVSVAISMSDIHSKSPRVAYLLGLSPIFSLCMSGFSPAIPDSAYIPKQYARLGSLKNTCPYVRQLTYKTGFNRLEYPIGCLSKTGHISCTRPNLLVQRMWHQ